MATHAVVADCQVTASSISATETLNPWRNWSLSDPTTCPPVFQRLRVFDADFESKWATAWRERDSQRQCKPCRKPQSNVSQPSPAIPQFFIYSLQIITVRRRTIGNRGVTDVPAPRAREQGS